MTYGVPTTNVVGMRLVIYSRTSSQNGNGADSLDAQEEACRAWADEHGHEVVATFRDEALSGRLPVEQRPGLLAALLALEEGRADGLVVHRVDRLARELHVQEAALARAWGVSDDVEVIEAVDGPMRRDDPDDPMRTFVRQVMGASAQLERGLIAARLQGGRRRKAARGEWIGGHRLHRRFGYEVVDGQYVPVDSEQRVIDRMAELRGEGLSYRKVADTLNAEGSKPPTGREWHAAVVRKVLIRPRP